MHNSRSIGRFGGPWSWLFAACLLPVACSADDADDGGGGTSNVGNAAGATGQGDAGNTGSAGDTGSPGDTGSAGHAGNAGSEGGAAGAGAGEPVVPSQYALAVEIYNPDNSSTTYVGVFDTLDVTNIDLTKMKEFAGRADLASYGGKLYVTSSEQPVLSRYAVAEDGTLSLEDKISFATLGLESTARSEIQFISPTKAYLGLDAGYEIWNPTTMKLTGELEVPEFPLEREGMSLNGSPGVQRGNRIYKSYFWLDWATYSFSAEQHIAVFDTDNDTLLSSSTEERCPGLSAQPVLDESGNIYFSNWFFNVPDTLMHDAPSSCAVRIPSDADEPDTWTLKFNEIANGHEGSQLSYIADKRAIFSVFHEEDFPILPDTAPYELTGSVNWETWGVNLDDSSAAPIAGVERAVATQGNVTLDGRTFVFLPGADWAATTVYEVLPDGKSRKAFEFDGASFQGFVKIK